MEACLAFHAVATRSIVRWVSECIIGTDATCRQRRRSFNLGEVPSRRSDRKALPPPLASVDATDRYARPVGTQ